MCFWEIIPSSFVFIKDYEGYDEVSKLVLKFSIVRRVKISSIAKSFYDPSLKVLIIFDFLFVFWVKCVG